MVTEKIIENFVLAYDDSINLYNNYVEQYQLDSKQVKELKKLINSKVRYVLLAKELGKQNLNKNILEQIFL